MSADQRDMNDDLYEPLMFVPRFLKACVSLKNQLPPKRYRFENDSVQG